MVEEARRTASVLGHNYPGSPWYQDSYVLLVEGAERDSLDRPSWFRRTFGGLF
jgi:outer membrane protein assembly factor BamD